MKKQKDEFEYAKAGIPKSKKLSLREVIAEQKREIDSLKSTADWQREAHKEELMKAEISKYKAICHELRNAHSMMAAHFWIYTPLAHEAIMNTRKNPHSDEERG